MARPWGGLESGAWVTAQGESVPNNVTEHATRLPLTEGMCLCVVVFLWLQVGLEGGEAAAASGPAAPSPSQPAPAGDVSMEHRGLEEGPMERPKLEPLAYSRKVLVKFLLRALAVSSYAPTSGVASRPQVRGSGVVLIIPFHHAQCGSVHVCVCAHARA